MNTIANNSAVLYGTDIGFHPIAFELSFKVYEGESRKENEYSYSPATGTTQKNSSNASAPLMSRKEISDYSLKSGSTIDVFIAFFDHTGRAVTASTKNLSADQLYERQLELSLSRSKIDAITNTNTATESILESSRSNAPGQLEI